jgi:prepilin peptidase CpaA
MVQSEMQALLELLGSLIFSGRTGVLMLFLVCAAVIDSRTHRIPNWLVFSGALYAIVYNTMFPLWPNATVFLPLAGLSLGLALFLPLYLLRAMGAGDVKLLAMVGAFVGAGAVWQIALSSMIVGGVLAIVYVLLKGTAQRLYTNLSALFRASVIDTMTGTMPNLHVATSTSAGRLPYGVAIALGTIGYLILRQLAFI